MFWRTPELVDKLIPHLDVESVSELAQVHQLTAQVLQEGTRGWANLVKRSCPFYEHKGLPVEEYSGWEDIYHDWVDERLSTQETNIAHLTRVLKRMENPKKPLLELLHVICERFPPVLFRPEHSTSDFEPEKNGRPMAFHLSCPCKRSHSVTHLGFLLLEKVEGCMKSAEQRVETAFPGNLEEPWFSALEARVARQEKKVQKVEAIRFVCNEQDQMEEAVGKLFSLQQNCKKLILPALWFWDYNEDEDAPRPRRLGQEFWASLAGGFKLNNFGAFEIWATRHDFQGASREDLRAIWDNMATKDGGYSEFCVTEVPAFRRHLLEVGLPYKRSTTEVFWDSGDKEERWMDFQMMLDAPPKQWPEALRNFLGVVVDEDGSDV